MKIPDIAQSYLNEAHLNYFFTDTNRDAVQIFKIPDHDLVILKKMAKHKSVGHGLEYLKQKSCALHDTGVNLTRTFNYRLNENKFHPGLVDVYLLQDMAPGTSLNSVMFDQQARQQFVNEPQSFFDKYILDYEKIELSMGYVDDHWTNFFTPPAKSHS